MENAKQQEVHKWVLEQTARLAPPEEWRPDPETALKRHHARLEARGSRPIFERWPAWAAAAVLGCAMVLLLPQARVAAQQLWQFLTVARVGFIRVNPWPEGVPSPRVGLLGTPLPPLPAHNMDEATQRVGYAPRLPHTGVLTGSPRFYTTFSLSAGTVVKAADLDLALRKAGVTDQTTPPQWDGAKLALYTSPVVIAEWPEMVLAQSLPLTLTAPPDFDFAAFSTLVLRVLGVGPEEARRLAERVGTAPPWLAPITQDLAKVFTIEEITLQSGPATLVEQQHGNGAVSRIFVVWSVPDRVYVLTGTGNRELTIAAANAVQ